MDLRQYEQLPPGSKVPMVCCKASKKTAVVFRDESKIVFWCARCGESHTLHTRRPLNWIKNIVPKFMQGGTKRVIPPDFSAKLDQDSLVWLGKAGVSGDVAIRYGVGYSESLHRCVLPVFNEDNIPVAAQYRALLPEQFPKYLTTSTTKDAVWLSGFQKPQRALVVTEDILSSIKVHHSLNDPGITTCAVMGTNISIERAFYAVQSSQPSLVIIWLDNDDAGIKGTKQISKTFRLLGVPTISVTSSKDPKNESVEYIRGCVYKSIILHEEHMNARSKASTSNEVQEGIQESVRYDS